MCPEEKNDSMTPETEENQSNAARVLHALGQDQEEAAAPAEKGSWFANFWYHHKWKVVIIGVFAFMGITLISQFASQSSPDIKILYAGPAYITPNQSQAFRSCLYDRMEDYNGDGEKKIAINDIVYLTAAQLVEYQAIAAERGEDFTLDRQANAQTAEQFTYEIMAGDALLCFLGEEQYLEVACVDAFVPLEEIFGYMPEGAFDESGIRFADTKFYKYFSQTHIFTEDTIVALRKLTTFNKIRGEEKMTEMQEHHRDLFYSIGTFEYPEGYTPPEETESE